MPCGRFKWRPRRSDLAWEGKAESSHTWPSHQPAVQVTYPQVAAGRGQLHDSDQRGVRVEGDWRMARTARGGGNGKTETGAQARRHSNVHAGAISATLSEVSRSVAWTSYARSLWLGQATPGHCPSPRLSI